MNSSLNLIAVLFLAAGSAAAEQTSAGKTVVLTLAGGVKLEMVRIPAGTFQMGSPETERGRSGDEGPAHTVNINYDFYMGKYEVTQAQWQALMKTKPYKIYGIGDNYPVFRVSWNDCQAFISALNQLNVGFFRLPSEAEWEYACRAGTKSRFYFGNSPGCGDYCQDCEAGAMQGKRSDYMWYCGDNVRDGEPEFGAKPVGQKLPNGFGLYDMSGNVWEWCQDEYHFNYEGAPTDGSAWQQRAGAPRVLRGGAWDYQARYCRSACRCGYSAERGYTFHGFRLVWLPYSRESEQWYGSWPAIFTADNIVSYQSEFGGWPKNMGFAKHGYQGEKFTRNWGTTIDNGATHTQMAFLARVYHATGKKRFRDSFIRGLDYLLEAQYDNGGWPQRYPLDKVGNDYGDYITFNDDAMVGVMRLMRDIADKKPRYSFIDKERRKKVETAVRKGLQCILNCQVVVDGKRSIWPQQCDEKTLEPRAARAFEPVSICSRESVSVINFLMEIERPSETIIDAIQSAVAWLDENKTIVRQAGINETNGRAMWARFYEIKSSRPLFAGTDAKVKHSLAEVDKDKRTGYSYLGGYASLLLSRDYPAWQKKWAPGKNVLEKSKKSPGKPVRIVESDEGFTFYEGEKKVLFYQRRPKSLDGKYTRCNYIHPVYGLDGEVLTEDFPGDHRHHRGIFWAWHELLIGAQKVGDGWSIEDFSMDVHNAKILKTESALAALKVEVLWKSPHWTDAQGRQKPFIKETTAISVHRASQDFRKIDFRINLLALADGVRIGGADNEKAYGGFSARIRLPKGIRFTCRDGEVEPVRLPVEAGPWLDFSGHFRKQGEISGLAILCHRSLPRYPPQWILRRKRSMQNAVYPGREPVLLSREKPVVLRYRLIVHRGKLTQGKLDQLQAQYNAEKFPPPE